MALEKNKGWSQSWSHKQGLDNSDVPWSWDIPFCVLGLVLFGSVMVFSATSSGVAGVNTYYLWAHIRNLIIAVIFGGIVYRVPMSFWLRYWAFCGGISFMLLLLVFVPGISRHINGASRWIALGPINLQVAELVKWLVVIFVAAFTVKRQNFMHSVFKGFMPMLFAMAGFAVLLMMQPDLGSMVVISSIITGILFLGGLSWTIFTAVISVLVLFVAGMIWVTPWRLGRFFAFLDPWNEAYVLGQAYQLSHSLIAFGRGELFGVGLGGSVEKLNYLPEAHTDFIMAVIAEETGFVGVMIILFLFYWLIRRAFEIGRQAIALERPFQGLVAQGVGIWFAVQVVINVGVASGALPTKGLTLPFVSYGGSALFASMMAIGLLLRIDRENKILMRGGQV